MIYNNVVPLLMISSPEGLMICHYSVMDKKSRIKIIRLFWWAEVEDWLRQSVVGDKLCEWHKFSNSRLLARTTDNTVFLQDTYIPQNSTSFEVLFCGGQRWIRTTEVEDVRFTV